MPWRLCRRIVRNLETVNVAQSTPRQKIVRQNMRAPARHGDSLQVPPLADAPNLVLSNQAHLASLDVEIAGQSVRELQRSARAELITLATQYTTQYRDVDSSTWSADSIVMSGHQPKLFHPGVWFKNFSISELGRSLGCTPINLIVDNDLCGLPAVSVPVKRCSGYGFESLHFDGPGDNVPFEMRSINDGDLFNSFGRRTATAIRPIVGKPLVERMWNRCRELARSTSRLGPTLAAARHGLESEFGWQTLELPLSQSSATRAFASFAGEILHRLPEFQKAYNQSLAEYREVYRIRSRSHPVPPLTSKDGWLEAPFWIYSANDPQRRRLFVRRSANNTALSNGNDWRLATSSDSLVDTLFRLAATGVCLRPRALTNTMYARLICCDLFVHGIGGAKYDELTDAICARFFGMAPPPFLLFTATLRLPGQENQVEWPDITRVESQLRELQFHPEKHLAAPESVNDRELAIAKRNLLAEKESCTDQREWRNRLVQMNGLISANTELLKTKLNAELLGLKKSFADAAVIGSREIPFCFFDDRLVDQFRAMTLKN